MVFAPSECFESSDPEAKERLREIERSNFSTLQQMNNQFQRSGGSSSYSGASGLSSGAGSRECTTKYGDRTSVGDDGLCINGTK